MPASPRRAGLAHAVVCGLRQTDRLAHADGEEHRRRHGGAITAAQFCSVSSVIRLGHLDVAGVAMDSTKNDISQTGHRAGVCVSSTDDYG